MSDSLRIYLTGRVCIEAGEELLEGQQLAGRQGRLTLAYLSVERARAVTRDELAALLWQDSLPESWETSLSAVISNLRKSLSRIGLSRQNVIEQAFGCYQLRLPATAWVDVEAAAQAIDQAEGGWRAGNTARAYGWAGVATAIARRSFLPGEDGPWIERWRRELREILLRGLDCFTKVLMAGGETQLAVKAATEAVEIDPFREVGYRLLMEAHAAAGNRQGVCVLGHDGRAPTPSFPRKRESSVSSLISGLDARLRGHDGFGLSSKSAAIGECIARPAGRNQNKHDCRGPRKCCRVIL